MSGSNSDDVRRIGTDPAAFEAFYRAHVDAVERFVVRRVPDAHRAADLTAEVFLAAIKSADGYRPSRGAPLAWLYGVARNVVAADRRRHGRELDAAQRFAGRRLVDQDDIARLEDRIDAEAQAGELYLALDRLSEAERAVLELVSVDGLSVRDAARALGIRPVTARVRLHRARQRLYEQLDPFAAEPAVTGSNPTEAAS
ncbi:MAG TPA: sigma-70 family RNA polymerase sigma factor [Nocardioidaceae bacterium]|nr:sigma-70 family RNA polymerase sigma factor [Nocardioidaceae bacterium]